MKTRKLNHRRAAAVAARVLAKHPDSAAARKLDTKSLRRAAKFISRRGAPTNA